MLAQLEQLLVACAFGDTLLLKLLVVCLYSVHQTGVPSAPGAGESAPKRQKMMPRTAGESLALAITYGYIGVVSDRAIELLENSPTTSRPNQGPKGQVHAYAHRLMVVLSVFAEWIACNPEQLQHRTEKEETSGGNGKRKSKTTSFRSENGDLFANKTLSGAEVEARTNVRKSLIRLKDALDGGKTIKEKEKEKTLWQPNSKPTLRRSQSDGNGFPSISLPPGLGLDVTKDSKPLKEHIELRGYSPLYAATEPYFVAAESNKSNNQGNGVNFAITAPEPLQEGSARERRMRVLKAFVCGTIVPSAVEENAYLQEEREAAAVRTNRAVADAASEQVSELVIIIF